MGCPFAKLSGGKHAANAQVMQAHRGLQKRQASIPGSGSDVAASAASAHVDSSISTNGGKAAATGARTSASAKSTGTSTLTLSQRLAAGTARAHKRIERSAGVRALLMTDSSGTGKRARGAHEEDGRGTAQVDLQRLDYMRWLAMLRCVYLALEAPLLSPTSESTSQSTESMLEPLLQSSLASPSTSALQSTSLIHALARSTSLVADLDAHARQLQSESGCSVQDHIDAVLLHAEPRSSGAKEEEEAEGAHRLLAQRLVELESRMCSTIAGEQEQAQPLSIRTLLQLLTPRQQRAVCAYVGRLLALGSHVVNPPSRPLDEHGARRLAHLYVRYMGDLSGGQFIRKYVAARWPCEDELGSSSNGSDGSDGFGFHDFAHRPDLLKDAFRATMEEGLRGVVLARGEEMSEVIVTAMIDEASLAFDLNRSLFDALVDADAEDEDEAADEEEDVKKAQRTTITPTPGLMGMTKQSSTLSTSRLVCLFMLLSALALSGALSSWRSHMAVPQPPILLTPAAIEKGSVGNLGMLQLRHLSNETDAMSHRAARSGLQPLSTTSLSFVAPERLAFV